MLFASITILIVSGLVLLVSTYALVGHLEDHGKKIDYSLVRPNFDKYLAEYKQLTVSETGKIGIHYFLCIASILLGFVSFIALVISFINMPV